MTRLVRVAAIAAVLLVAVAGWKWWNGPERQIGLLLEEIAEALSQDDEQRGLAHLAAGAGLGRLLAADVVIEPEPPFHALAGRDAALAGAAALRAAVRGMRVAFTDVRIGVAPDGRSATVSATAKLTIPQGSAPEQVEAREVLLSVTMIDGRWVVSRATAVPVFERID
jgi:ketosteroid isomerase-like protein